MPRTPVRRAATAAVVLATVAAVGIPTATAAANSPDWSRYVLAPTSPTVAPVDVDSRGDVANARTLVKDMGRAAVLTTTAGQTPASFVLDFGKDIAGVPFVDVTSVNGAAPVSLTLNTAEARQYLRRAAVTTVTTTATAGATTIALASAANLEAGNSITFGTGSDAQTATITAFDTTTRTVTITPAITHDVAAATAVSSSPGAPASDESRGLAGVGGIDTLQPTQSGRVSGGYHGGFRFVLLTLTTPGSVSISAVGVDFQGVRVTADDYKGWFLTSDDQLNRMWYAGAYTLQLNLKPAGLNSLADQRIYDGAKRDRSIWTGDLLVQAPTAISTLGDLGAQYVKSSLNVLLATQRADGALPGSPDFRKGTSPAGSPLFYSNNYSGYGVRAAIDYYRYSGDQAYISSVLPALRNEIAYNDQFLTADNLVASSDRDYWQATQTGEVTKYSIDYYILLREMAWLERSAGTAAAADAYDAKAAAIKTAVMQRMWNPQLGAYGQSSDHPDVLVEDANALALQYGFVPADRRDRVLTALRQLWTPYGAIMGLGLQDPTGHTIEPFGNGMETAGRFAAGDTSGAIELMRRTWGQMVDEHDPLYTGGLWEFKNTNGGVNRATASLAHGWAASPTVQLTEQVLGVTPVGAGYSTWSIMPHIGELTFARGRVPTKFGDIDVDWSTNAHAGWLRLHVRTPSGTSGVIAVPLADDGQTVTVNGERVWDGHHACGRYNAELIDGYVQFTVPGGQYDVTVKH